MSTQTVPCNIRSHAAALAEGLSCGDRVHLGVCGNHVTEDFLFYSFLNIHEGIVVVPKGVNGRTSLLWGDIIELWLLEEKPNIYHSDVPEVVEVLKRLKVEVNNSVGVLYLLDQVAEAKKAEHLFKEARKIVAGIRF